jgi:peptidoglycan/LPS O-acetylase OafA/YrhL
MARLGDYTYGLYLVHVPVMVAGFYLLTARGWLVGTDAGAWLVGTAAVGIGLLFGWVESRLHGRMRPLAKLELADLSGWPGRVLARLRARPTAHPRQAPVDPVAVVEGASGQERAV